MTTRDRPKPHAARACAAVFAFCVFTRVLPPSCATQIATLEQEYARWAGDEDEDAASQVDSDERVPQSSRPLNVPAGRVDELARSFAGDGASVDLQKYIVMRVRSWFQRRPSCGQRPLHGAGKKRSAAERDDEDDDDASLDTDRDVDDRPEDHRAPLPRAPPRHRPPPKRQAPTARASATAARATNGDEPGGPSAELIAGGDDGLTFNFGDAAGTPATL